RRPNWRKPSARWLKEAERFARLEEQLPAVLKGEVTPADAAEQLEYATVCGLKKYHAAAVTFCTAAFAADPKLENDLQSGMRYNAACSALLAANGRGEDSASLDDKEKKRLRRLALDWLRADLSLWQQHAAAGKPKNLLLLQEKLQNWLRSPDLASVRQPQLNGLPQEEREEWMTFWGAVHKLLRQAGGPRP